MNVGDIVTINREAVAKDHPALQHGGEGLVMAIEDDRVWVKPSQASPIYIMTMEELLVGGTPEVAPAAPTTFKGFTPVTVDDVSGGTM